MCYAKPGPRCSKHAADALRAALRSGDEEAIRQAKRDYALTPKGIARLKAQGEVERAEACQKRRNEMIAAYTQNLRVDQLQKELTARLSSDEFKHLLQERDDKVAALLAKETELEDLKKDEEATFEQLRDMRNEVKEAFFSKLDAAENLDAYKNETAHLVARISDNAQMFGEEYTGDRIGNAVPMEEHVSNSREWLKQRQEGIGGSDVGAILKVDPEWGRMNYDRALVDKSKDYDAMSDDEFHPTEWDEDRAIHNPMQRGDAWEPVIANIFADRNPDLKVMHTKRTWRSADDPEMMANFDGLVSSREDGVPDGILEIKTSSRREDWDQGVPPGYRAQVLHYLDVTGLDHGYVAVQIDDQEYRQYRIERGEPITPRVGTVAENKDKLKEFLNKARRIRHGEEARVSSSGRPPHPPITHTTGNASAEKLLAAYTGKSPEEIRASLESRGSATDYDAAVRAEFAESRVGDGDKVFVDLETTGFKPETAEIIEIGWTRRNKQNEVVDEGTMRFSPDPRFLRTRGTGASHIHGIKPEDVVDKPRFSDPESQERIRRAFQGATLVAHNASFERSFLDHNLEGFHEEDHPIIDTMLLNKFFEMETPNNTLASFTKANGVSYENAHHALDDANMTGDAFFNFAKKTGTA